MDEHENCDVEPVEKPVDEAAMETAMAAYLSVGGMGCPRCATRVRNGLLALPGVLLVEVFLERGLAAAAYDPVQVSPEDLVRAVAGAGSDGRHRYWAEVERVLSAADALQQ